MFVHEGLEFSLSSDLSILSDPLLSVRPRGRVDLNASPYAGRGTGALASFCAWESFCVGTLVVEGICGFRMM